MIRRAYTLVEVLIATALLSLIVAAVAALFGFTTKRSLYGVARFSLLRTGGQSLSDLTSTVENAIDCTRIPNGASYALVCTMPLSGSDFDGDGFKDAFTPIRIGKRSQIHYGSGQRVWYYLSTKEGAFGVPGPYLFRAVRNDSLTPAVTDIDQRWSVDYVSGKPKRGPFQGISFTVDSLAKTVQVVANVETAIRTEQAPTSGEQSRSIRLTETAYWRNDQ